MLRRFSRLSLHNIQTSMTKGISTTNNSSPLFFKATTILFGEPLKKKKRIDPAIIRNREERKRKKLEKQIRRLEKHAKQLKPIDEVEIPFKLIDEKSIRIRDNVQPSQELLEKRVQLEKTWIQYKNKQNSRDMLIIESILSSQKRALDELQTESNQLYQAAIQLDELSLLPYFSNVPAPIVNTPPITNYSTPDGNYSNISIKFEGDETVD